MANRNNSGRAKKSHGYKPYDTSNSFVKRITAKVTEILPQPTSWVSRWFSPASKLNTRGHEELDEEDDEEEERQPPTKRLCFGPPDTSDYTHQNNTNRLNAIEQESGDLSPILSNRTEEDRAVPGPSGLHLRNFVSSTPAVRQTTTHSSPKITLRDKVRDDASDGSETTSGCSSLVPGSERPRARQEHLSTPVGSPNIQNISSVRRTSTNTLKATSLLNRSNSMNLSASSHPSFDTYIFNNPLNRSGIRRKSIADDSCFYPGETTFGGSSSRLSAPVDPPRVVSVRPSPSKQVQQDTIGTSAMRILRALEQFSTPVLDAKRIPMRKEETNERKRKAPQPYEELIYPSMPDLLRVKRREQQYKNMRRSTDRSVKATPPTTSKAEASSKSSTSTPLPLPLASTVPSGSTSFSTTGTRTPTSTPTHTFPSTPYSFRADNANERHRGSIKGRSKDDELELERVPEVNLPNVKLQLPSLPKLDIPLSTPQQKVSNLQSKASLSSKSPPFKFSDPEEIIIKPQKEGNVVPVNSFKFSEPLEPLELNKNSSPAFAKTENKSPSLNMKSSSPSPKLKRKSSETNVFPNLLSNIKPVTEVKNASLSDVFSKKPFGDNSPKNSIDSTCNKCNTKISSGKAMFGTKCNCEEPNAFAPKESSEHSSLTWSCKMCSLKNQASEAKCKSCGADKNGNSSTSTFMGFKKPTDTWECSSCLVNNKTSADICSACSSPKPGKTVNDKKPAVESSSVKSSEHKVNDIGSKSEVNSSPLFNSIKKQDTWECSSCLVKNKIKDDKCACCSTSKPGCAPSSSSEKATLTFSFGIPSSSSTTESKAFNSLPKSESQSTIPKFTFGLPPDNKNNVSSSSTKLESEEKKENVPADSSTAVSSSLSFSTSTPLLNSIKKPGGTWECSVCLIQNKLECVTCAACNTPKPGVKPVEKPQPTFSFGIPESSTVTINSTPFPANSTNEDSSKPQFKFGSNPSEDKKPQFTFGNPSSDDKKTTTLFGFPSAESKSNCESKSFNLVNSGNSTNEEQVKPVTSNLFAFGNSNKETKNEEPTKESDDKPAKKKVSFGTPLTFEKPVSNDSSSNSSPFGKLPLNKTNEISSSNFSFPSKTPVLFGNSTKNDTMALPNTNSLFAFGSGNKDSVKTNDLKASEEPSKHVTFGLSSDKPAEVTNSNAIFSGNSLPVFKPTTTENKPFAFMANSQPSQGGFSFNPPSAPTTDFSSQSNQVTPSQAPALFGQQQSALAPSSLFSQPSQEQKPFVFGASNQQQAQATPPAFNFSTTSAQQPGGLGSGTPTFGSFTAPSAPKFDPNIKPSFNFTGGATPSFSATPTNSLSDVNIDTKRKVRKAIRRTTQNR